MSEEAGQGVCVRAAEERHRADGADVRRRGPDADGVRRDHETAGLHVAVGKVDGKRRTVNLLFRWTDDKHFRARTYDDLVWKPALVHAGVRPEPTKDARRSRQSYSSRENGMHALRHYYASITLADGVNIKELAQYLGHGDRGLTLRLYTRMLPSSHERRRRLSTRGCLGCSRWRFTEL